jgi:hypothetical protein
MTPIRCAVESVAKIEDPGTFIVKTTKLGSRSAAYNSAGFGEAWRMAIQCYLPEIRTPTAKLSRACGLKGPIASGMSWRGTCSKQTGSFEKASYAIQDTPKTRNIMAAWCRRIKAALTAEILNSA